MRQSAPDKIATDVANVMMKEIMSPARLKRLVVTPGLQSAELVKMMSQSIECVYVC